MDTFDKLPTPRDEPISSPQLPTLDDCRRAAVTCASGNLRKAARSVTQVYEDALRPLGIRATQFPILMATHALRSVSVTELADTLFIDRTTLTRNLRPLERRGLLSIEVARDRRVKMIALTDVGRDLLARAYSAWVVTQREVAEGLGPDRLQRLLDDLSAAVDFAHDR